VGIGQFISNLARSLDQSTCYREKRRGNADANIACPLAIAGEYWGDCDGVADGIE
jgi:hypothetical protein